MDPLLFIEVWKVGGVVAVLVVYLLVRDHLRDKMFDKERREREERNNQREAALAQRIQEIDDYQREELYTLATEANRAVLEAAKAQLESARISGMVVQNLKEVITSLKTRRCLADDMKVLENRQRAVEDYKNDAP